MLQLYETIKDELSIKKTQIIIKAREAAQLLSSLLTWKFQQIANPYYKYL